MFCSKVVPRYCGHELIVLQLVDQALPKNFPIKTKERERGLSSGGRSPDAAVTGGQAGAAGACFLLGAGPLATHWPPKARQPSRCTYGRPAAASAAVSVPEALAEKKS